MRPLLFAALSLALALPVQAAGPKSFPGTRDGIHLEMVFNHSPFDGESGVIDVAWGSYSPDQPADVYNSFYIPVGVDDPFAFNTHDIAWYRQNHPDWLEYLCDRKTLAIQFNAERAPLDFANPDVRAAQWAAIDDALGRGYPSVAVDEVYLFNDFRRCGHYDLAQHWVQQYGGDPGDPKYHRDALKWQILTYRHIHRQSATMQINRPFDGRTTADDMAKLLNATDLVFDEGGFTNYGQARNVTTPDEWEAITGYVDLAQNGHGLCYMTNGEEPGATADITPQERQWVIGNYLLVKGKCTYMYMTGYQDYGGIVHFPEYDVAIGHPSGDRFAAQGIWERKYSGGLTLVNPYDTTAVVTLPRGRWKDVNGAPVSSPVSLPRQTALVLLKDNS